MADNLKPYDPNKGFISFRLNPDAIKEEALNLIPWPVGTIAREMYRNPDGSIVETAKQVGRETPVLGSLLSGEYSDAAKEAILFGFPVGKGYRQEISNLANKGYRFRVSEPTAQIPGHRYTMDEGEIYAYKPDKNGRVSKSMVLTPRNVSKYKQEGLNYDNVYNGKPEQRGYYAWYRDPIKPYKDISGNELLNLIDESNKVHETVPSLVSRDPYLEANKDMTGGAIPNSLERSVEGPLAYKLDEMNRIETLLEGIDNAKAHKKLSEDIVIENADIFAARNDNNIDKTTGYKKHEPRVRLYSSRSNTLRRPGSNDKYPMYSRSDYVFNPQIDRNLFETDMKRLQNDIDVRNLQSMFDDYVVPVDPKYFKEYHAYMAKQKYLNDLDMASQPYRDAINGPFLEDLLDYPR